MSERQDTDRTTMGKVYRARIRRFSRVRRGLVNHTAAYRGGCVLLALLALLLGWSALPVAHPLLDAVLILGAVLLVGILVLRYVWRYRRFEREISEAFRMEELAGGLDSRLISALDFLAAEDASPLMDVVIESARQDLERIPFESRLDRRAHRRVRRRFFGLLVVALLVGLTPWVEGERILSRSHAAWWAVREQAFPTEWELVPGEGRHVHLVGESVEVGLRFTRNPHHEVVLLHDATDGHEPPRRTVLPVDADGVAGTVIRGEIESVHQLQFEFGLRATRSEVVELVFTTRPVIENMQTELFPPAYTRQPPRDLEGVQSRIAGLPGTRVALGLTFSKSLASATLHFDGDEQAIPLDTVGRFAAIQFVIADVRRARIQIEDVHGFGLRQPHALDIALLVDEPPRLAVPGFLKAEMPTKADALRTFGFGVRAWDDYGVSQAVLKWRQSTLDNRHTIVNEGEVERIFDPPQASVVADFMDSFAERSFRPGDVISFHVEAADNRDPNPQIARSPTFSFFVHQDDLDGAMGMDADMLFGAMDQAGRGRVGRSRVATDVASPQDLRTVGGLQSDYEAEISSAARPPSVRGDFGTSVERYFQVLSTARFAEEETE